MRWTIVAGIGLALLALPASAQTPPAPKTSQPKTPPAADPSKPPTAPAAEPGELSHEEMMKEQERRDREKDEERDRDDQAGLRLHARRA
jgi:hypothetical protein